MYGYSVLCCLPNGLAGQPTRPADRHGDAPGDPAPLRAQAGFGAVEILPIEHDLFRLYRLHV